MNRPDARSQIATYGSSEKICNIANCGIPGVFQAFQSVRRCRFIAMSHNIASILSIIGNVKALKGPVVELPGASPTVTMRMLK